MSVKEDVKRYFKFLAARLDIDSVTFISPLFELNTSRAPKLTQAIICHEFNENISCVISPKIKYFLLLMMGSIRVAIKWFVIILLAKVIYRKRNNHIERIKKSNAILVGFVALREGVLNAKDFDGFMDNFPEKELISIIGLRLPSVSMTKYLAGNHEVIPLLGHIQISAVLKSLLMQVLNGVKILKSFNIPQSAREICSEDWLSGHSCASYIYGDAIKRIVMNSQATAVTYFPFERHDWEQVALTGLKGFRKVECVQNCTFSPLDLNMYANFQDAPAYRKTQPDRIHAINSSWASIFRESLGFLCPIEIMHKHRFSDASFQINLDGSKKRMLVISGINKEKLDLDLKALLPIATRINVDVRIHPSITNFPLNAIFNIAPRNSFEDYGCCVFGDTSMVFQLICDHKYLIYIDHDSIPNQNPTQWFSDFGSENIKAEELLSKFSFDSEIELQKFSL